MIHITVGYKVKKYTIILITSTNDKIITLMKPHIVKHSDKGVLHMCKKKGYFYINNYDCVNLPNWHYSGLGVKD